ncbi:hypothetical protein KPH14_008243 [Odynerus spinipes]|uniref:CHCH domain-containing protein n=1 Tax=Odynerus spinipes TaxID=1348599 RepID=A0AAD9RGF2_9HYME|nr:hypothetical protein KPH14_008243 [Odynerus spinipes]
MEEKEKNEEKDDERLDYRQFWSASEPPFFRKPVLQQARGLVLPLVKNDNLGQRCRMITIGPFWTCVWICPIDASLTTSKLEIELTSAGCYCYMKARCMPQDLLWKTARIVDCENQFSIPEEKHRISQILNVKSHPTYSLTGLVSEPATQAIVQFYFIVNKVNSNTDLVYRLNFAVVLAHHAFGGMATGPCGLEFREAFSCFHYSTAEPKGADCREQFTTMQICMSDYPELYGAKDSGDDEEKTSNSEMPNVKEMAMESKDKSKIETTEGS